MTELCNLHDLHGLHHFFTRQNDVSLKTCPSIPLAKRLDAVKRRPSEIVLIGKIGFPPLRVVPVVIVREGIGFNGDRAVHHISPLRKIIACIIQHKERKRLGMAVEIIQNVEFVNVDVVIRT